MGASEEGVGRGGPPPAGRLYLGTSGFDYGDWRGRFYPEGLPRREWLAYYATRFNAVEVNATFYRLPRPATVRRWVERVPEGFAFVFKAPRGITHDRRLAPDPDLLAAFLEALEPARAAGRLGAILWQLPPSLPRDLDRLQALLAVLPADVRHAFEFRHPSWDHPAVHAFFRTASAPAAFVDADGPSLAPPEGAGGSFLYVRRHGTEGLGRGAYGPARLADLAGRIRAALGAGRDALVFFNNGVGAAAPEDASLLRTYLQRTP